MNIKRLIPFRIRMWFSKKYADQMLNDAIEKANRLHKEDGHRYFVLPTVSGNLKVTDIDHETRDRKRDKRILKKSVRSPYQLRRESFYFTASTKAKEKYIKRGMQDWEVENSKEAYYRWYFSCH